jgi:NADH:ubiquinone oxidoreductase subunit 5 (subunit L)/multisubunit Na+/H+ antiporter MnhA subunit
MILSLVRLCGLPFFTGFFSKELALETTFTTGKWVFIFYLSYFPALCSITYTIRILKLVIFNFGLGSRVVWAPSSLNGFYFRIMPLILMSLIGGKYLKKKLYLSIVAVGIDPISKIYIPLFIFTLIFIT